MDHAATSQYRYKLISLCTPQPTQLVAIFSRDDRLWFCCSQVFKQCLASTCSYSTWQSTVKAQPRSRLVVVNAADRLLLVKLGALSHRANCASIISATVTCKAMKACRADTAIVGAFDQARLQPQALAALPLPGHVLQPSAQPSPNPPGLQLLSPLPVTLPPCLFRPAVGKRYGLAASKDDLWCSHPLKQQMTELKQYTMAAIQLDRAGPAHGSRTWENNQKNISLFLGFSFHCHQVQQPTLQLYLDPNLIAQYVSWRMDAQHSSLSIKSSLATAAVVVRWWQTKPGGHHPSLPGLLEWLSRLGQQVKRCMPRDLVSNAQADSWMSAADVVKLNMAAKQQAEQAYVDQGASLAACRQLHDAALGCTMFGYLPPVRLSCIRSMTHPSYSGPCLHPDCKLKDCRGNRLIIEREHPLQLAIDLPHHKNQAAHGFKPIHFTVPAGLAELLYLLIGQPHQVLTQAAAHVLLDAHCPFVFMTKTGQGFKDCQLCTYWSAWLVAHGGSPMPPSKLRQVFVAERRSDDRAAGPSDAAAARVMGHSAAQWTTYDVHLHNRETQIAVDAMPTWRQHMLQHESGTDAGPSGSATVAMPQDDDVVFISDEDVEIVLE